MKCLADVHRKMIKTNWDFKYPVCISIYAYDLADNNKFPECNGVITGRLKKMKGNEIEVLNKEALKVTEISIGGLEDMKLVVLNRHDCMLIGNGAVLRIRQSSAALRERDFEVAVHLETTGPRSFLVH